GVNSSGTPYQRTKFMAEQYLKFTGLKYTIIRPSVIFGDPRGKLEFCTQLKKQLLDVPLPAPAFFKGLNFTRAGRFYFTPIHVKNVSRIIVEALEFDNTVGKTLELGGPDAFSWNQILKMIASAAGRSKWLIPVPVWGPKLAAFFFDRFLWFPVSRHQLIMLLEGNSCDSSALFNTYNIKAIPFNEENLLYLA
ncbi:MAG: complex I NDUFA9 subunit family protein, partial [Candidatus Neomarinimicrobiota bacterium]